MRTVADPRLVRVAWAYPASLVVPVAGLGVLMLAWPAGFGVGWAMLMGLAGLVGWTLIEYLLHRFMLHRVEPFRAWHFEHHRRAADPIHVPISFSIALVLSMIGLPAVLSGFNGWAVPFAMGLLIGNVLQESVHERLHRREPGSRWLVSLRALHGYHHFQDEQRAYGTLTGVWDRCFGTARPPASER